LDQAVQEINREIPGYKGIRSYVYSFQELIKTTTLKIKRPNEIKRIQETLDRTKVRFRQLTGKNIDLLDSLCPIVPLESLGENDTKESAEADLSETKQE